MKLLQRNSLQTFSKKKQHRQIDLRRGNQYKNRNKTERQTEEEQEEEKKLQRGSY